MARDPSRPEQASSPDGVGLGLQPLTARSVILSVLLGTHPPLLPVRSLVRTTELFGITEGTTRVALSRLVADHEVVADGSRYGLSDRLMARQGRLDEGRAPATRPWRGSWEMAVTAPTSGDGAGRDGSGSAATGRAALAAELSALRLGELRSGVWARPTNLRREWPSSLRDRVWRFEVRTIDSPGGWRPAQPKELAADLWDLEGWGRGPRPCSTPSWPTISPPAASWWPPPSSGICRLTRCYRRRCFHRSGPEPSCEALTAATSGSSGTCSAASAAGTADGSPLTGPRPGQTTKPAVVPKNETRAGKDDIQAGRKMGLSPMPAPARAPNSSDIRALG